MRPVLVAALVGLAAHGCNTVCEGPACEGELDPCTRDGVPRLRLQAVRSLATSEFANPEIVGFIPGESRALVTSTLASRVSELVFDGGRVEFGTRRKINTGNESTDLTSVAVSPIGHMAAITLLDEDHDCSDHSCICYPGALPGCRCGAVQFVDTRSEADHFGKALGESPIEVGYAPDSGAFSVDGHYFVTADEDDHKQGCKPEDRDGGSVSIIEIGVVDVADCETEPVDIGSAGLACRVGQIVVDHAKAEPEGVAITKNGDVIVTLQESSEVAFFKLEPPWEIEEIVPITTGTSPPAEPDGLAVTPDGKWVAVGLENADGIAIFNVVSREQVGTYFVSDDVPSRFNRDWRADSRMHEPEQMAFVGSQDDLFLVVALQESHALIAYRFDEGKLEFDSIAAVGLAPESEAFGRGGSRIGPEGVAATIDPDTGRALFLTANEREGSVTFLRSICPVP